MSAPVKNTCPDIDKAIKRIKLAVRCADNGRSQFKGEDAEIYFKDISDEIDGLEGMLEDLRSSNDALRKWGEGLFDEVESLSTYVNELEEKLEGMSRVGNNSQ
jgi:hypothetical protein